MREPRVKFLREEKWASSKSLPGLDKRDERRS